MATPASSGLTIREDQIARLVACGHTDREIARILNVAASTVRCHLRTVRVKLAVHTRVEVALYVWRVHRSSTSDYIQ